MRRAALLLLLLAACSREGRRARTPRATTPPAPPVDAAMPSECRAGGPGQPVPDPPAWFAIVQRRRMLGVPCLMPCDPAPSCAAGTLGRNEEGGYSYLGVDPAACRLPGLELPEGCNLTCDRADRAGEMDLGYAVADPAVRTRVCRALNAWRGPPAVGDCNASQGAAWAATETLPSVSMGPGYLKVACGVPPGAFAPNDF